MPTYHSHEVFDRFQAGSHGTGTPFIQIPLSPIRALVVPEELKTFLEQISTNALQIILKNIGQYHLYVIEKIQRGIKRAETEGAVSQDEVEKKFIKWTKE